MISKISYLTLFTSCVTAYVYPEKKKQAGILATCILGNDLIDYIYLYFDERYRARKEIREIIILCKTFYYYFSYKYINQTLQFWSQNNKMGFFHNTLAKFYQSIDSCINISFKLNAIYSGFILVSLPLTNVLLNRYLNNFIGNLINIINRINLNSEQLDNLNIEYNGIKLYSSTKFTKEDIDKIAQLRCAALKNINEEKSDYSHPENCSVCLDTFNEKKLSRTLPCKHSFHAECLDQWMLKHFTCPFCRMDFKEYIKK